MVLCVVCAKLITPRQHVLGPCDNCGQCQHRICNSGITLQEYRQLQRTAKFPWSCNICRDSQRELLSSVTDGNVTPDNLSFEMPISQSSVQKEDNGATEITFKIVERGTERGKPALTDSHGGKYSRHRVLKSGSIDWCCSTRTKELRCPGFVKQKGTSFTLVREHLCKNRVPGRDILVEMKRDMKDAAIRDQLRSAQNIVEEVFTSHTKNKDVPMDMPKFPSLVRLTNRAREKHRPKHQQTNQELQSNLGHVQQVCLHYDISDSANESNLRCQLIFAIVFLLSLLAPRTK